jgi:hypothetical protein
MVDEQQENISPEDKAVKEIIKHRVEAFNQHRRSRMLNIRANVAYLCGHQNIQVINNKILPIPETSVQCTPVVCNLILPAVINDISVGTKVPPVFDVVPAGTDEDDRTTAKTCQKVLPYLLRINNYTLHRESVILWYDIDGVGWRKVYWDGKASVVGINPPEGTKGFNPNLPAGAPIYQGEVVVEPVPNPELVFDWRRKSLDKLDWIIHAKQVTISYVRQEYGDEFVDGIDQEQIKEKTDGTDEFEVEIRGEFARLAESIAPAQAKPEESKLLEDDKVTIRYEYWHKPTASMPTGAYAVLIGDKIAENKPYPIKQYLHGELPFIHADPVPLSGITIGSVSRISQARPLNREYNELRSTIRDNISAMGNSVFMAPRESKLDFKKIANVAANIIEYDGPFKPAREPGVPIPGALFPYMAEVKRGIDEIFSFHDPTKGMMPVGGPKSGRGLEVLQMADLAGLGPMTTALELSDQKVVYQMLTLAVANYREKLISIVGEDCKWVLERINQNELKGKINVIVKRNSSLPINKTFEAQKAFEIWASGLLGDPTDPNVRLYTIKQMDLGNIDNILQTNAKQVNFARREFLNAEQMTLRMPPIPPDLSTKQIEQHLLNNIYVPPPNSFDDHFVHVFEHTEHLLDNYWKYLATDAPQMRILLSAMIAHIEAHKQIISQIQQRQIQQQTLAQAYVRGATEGQILLKQAAQFEKAKNDTRK